MSEEVMATLISQTIEATVRKDKKGVEAAVSHLFLQGTPADGLRFCIACMLMLNGLLPPGHKRLVTAARRMAQEGDMRPGEFLFMQMMADIIEGDQEAASFRWIDALVAETWGPTGAPGAALGLAVRAAADLIRASRASFQ
jgi:hypothetical protein